MDMQLKVEIPRNAPVSTYRFTDYFKGFEKLDCVRKIFGEGADQSLSNLKVEFIGWRGYMGVSDLDGHLLVGSHYLANGDIVDIYLDIIHELVHVRQFNEGKELFDNDYSYVERPTEVEAYHVAVDEARRLGLTDERICEYLKTEWMSDEELMLLAKAMNVKCTQPLPSKSRSGRRRR